MLPRLWPRRLSLWGVASLGSVGATSMRKTAMIGMDQLDIAAADYYANQFARYVKRYGSVIWAVAYQADVRCRLERMPRIRSHLSEEHKAALALGGSTKFDTARPWNMVWREATDPSQVVCERRLAVAKFRVATSGEAKPL